MVRNALRRRVGTHRLEEAVPVIDLPKVKHRVLVVSRDPSVVLGLTSSYDVYDIRPDRYDEWLLAAQDMDAIVLGVSDPVAAAAALTRLRESGIEVPVIAVSSPTPGWDLLAQQHLPHAQVLTLPITRDSLLNAVATAVTGRPIVQLPDQPAPAATPQLTVEPVIDDVIVEPVVEDVVAEPVVEDVPVEPEPEAEPEPVAEVVPVEREPELEPEPVAEVQPQREEPELEPLPINVGLAAEIVASEITEQINALAAALLIPSGNEWVIAGGLGVRDREREMRLTDETWLIAEAIGKQQAMLIHRTDEFRPQLVGTPLGSHASLIAIPLPNCRALLLAGRDDREFDDTEMVIALRVSEEAAELLREELTSS